MIAITPTSRRRWRAAAIAGTAASAMMLVLSVASVTGPVRPASAAGTFQGAVNFRSVADNQLITSGGSAAFNLVPPSGASCPGNATTTPSYRYQMFIVSASVDPGTLTYQGSSGPVAIDGAFVSAMFDSTGSKWVNKFPAVSPSGLIADAPSVSFGFFAAPAPTLAAGSYKVGFACTTGGVTATYWMSQITVTANNADSPAKIGWAIDSTPVTTTTTTTVAATTTTTTAAATTTTKPATTSTTVATSSTSSTSVLPTTTLVQSLAPTTTRAASLPVTSFPVTGTSPIPTVVWAILLLAFGRMAIVLARPIQVLPDRQ